MNQENNVESTCLLSCSPATLYLYLHEQHANKRARIFRRGRNSLKSVCLLPPRMKFIRPSMEPFLHTPSAAMVRDGDLCEWICPELPNDSTIIQAGRQVQIRWTWNLHIIFPNYIPYADTNDFDPWLLDTQGRSITHKICGQCNPFLVRLALK